MTEERRPRKVHENHEALAYAREMPPRQYSPAQHSSSPGGCCSLPAPLCASVPAAHTQPRGRGCTFHRRALVRCREMQHTNKRGATHGHLAYKNLTCLESPQQFPVLVFHSCTWEPGSAACSYKQQRDRRGSQKGRAARASPGRACCHVMATKQSSHP